MALRLIESIIPAASLSALEDLPENGKVVDRWDEMLNDEKALVRILVDAGDVESLMDKLVERFANVDGFRVMLIPVEATLPRPVEPEANEDEVEEEKSAERINREEIYNQVSAGANITRVFIAQAIIATLVAAVGLIRGDTAILIGAMVIAPLLGPNMALCLATTLGDWKLVGKSLKANIVGLAIAFLSAAFIGILFPVSVTQEAIAARTQVSGGDIILALASGCAGVLAFTSGAPSALIGVMVAVALLPPFAVFGMLLVSGDYKAASGALMLVSANVICVNLAGTLTFLAQGLRPHSWWEANRAKRAVRIAIAIWAILLFALAALIYLEFGYSLEHATTP
ncbi:TIGR00341 family protein [Mariniblastus fucicola]|uniref:TIGR00341 family protein n=1 Tax=Mariniblastus fucicola TaxID=980251 RepID=A0A5B9P7L3_9BACT|nr:TIGR00341 family protein [Mariniblastus fucicola]QEG22637.1 hypothetical protein MFFC18_25200 [Mariniblastus fucicola]